MLKHVKSAIRPMVPSALLMWRERRYFRKYGELELGLVPDLCKPHLDSIDVGANEGGYVHLMRRHSRHVYAFEPVPWLAERLRRKFPTKVTVISLALSGEQGEARLRIPLLDGRMETGLSTLSAGAADDYPNVRELVVPTATLDSVYSGVVGFMKIDVEGHEEAVLTGSRETIARCRPRILVEIEEHRSPQGTARIAALLDNLGYHGFFIRQRQLRPIGDFDPRSMQRPEDLAGFEPGTARKDFDKFVNNFLFLPKEDSSSLTSHIRARLAHM